MRSQPFSFPALLFGALACLGIFFGGATQAYAAGSGHHDEHGEAHDSHAVGAPHVNWLDLDYGDKNSAGEPYKKGDEHMAPPLVFALINFFLFAGILYWKGGPVLRKYFRNRHLSIKDALEEAARLQEEAKEKLAEYSSRIADADAEVNALIAQIRKEAEAERATIVADAERLVERMKKDAEDRIQSEFLAARKTLERDVLAKAVQVAEATLRKQTTPADHANLVANFLTELAPKKTDATDNTTDGGWS